MPKAAKADQALQTRFNLDPSALDNPTKVRLHVLVKSLPETPFQDYIVDLCVSGKLNRAEQVVEACNLISSGFDLSSDEQKQEFEQNCGVGVSYTDEQVQEAAKDVVAQFSDALHKERYAFNTLPIRTTLMEKLPWVDGRQLKQAMDDQISALIGPLTEEERQATISKKRAKDKQKSKTKPAPAVDDKALDLLSTPISSAPRFPAPEKNTALNTPANLKAHLQRTGGRVITRFPPEPNGYLHIGHAKSMCLNFGEAAKTGGECILRFDDTNPEAEKSEFFKTIIANVEWLGFKPSRITHSSDYFDRLYDDAVELIKRGKAYVDHLTGPEFAKLRESREESPYRNRPIEENLKLFEFMRQGRFAEGEAVLRMKMDMKSDNPCMRDLVAYRIKFTAHPQSGDKWCIYPSYDFTHCLVDSYEDITHSLCTLEFEIRRDSYYWLLNALDKYCPLVWEFSRLNIYGSLMSKRRINKLINEGILTDFDDPRLYTLLGLQRRGVTPSIIKKFCELVSVSRGSNVIHPQLLDHVIRSELDDDCDRRLVVLDPIKLVIDDAEHTLPSSLEIPNHPKFPDRGTRHVDGSNHVYIDSNDFKAQDEPGFFRLAPGKTVRLRGLGVIKCTGYETDSNGKVNQINGVSLPKETKTKVTIHWVSAEKFVSVGVNVYSPLFKADIENPGALPDAEWMALIDADSCRHFRSVGECELGNLVVGSRIQFERIGYFVLNEVNGKKVFESTVMLKQDI
ncbi:hypothetical protein GEMRC1_007039 [Eukaryota sp. GEM-RC1]